MTTESLIDCNCASEIYGSCAKCCPAHEVDAHISRDFCREAFEAWLENTEYGNYSTARSNEKYDSSHTQIMWMALQRSIYMKFILLLLIFFPFFAFAQEDLEIGQTKTYKLVALRHGNNEIHGSFFLGIGNVDSYPVYIYYYIASNGAYKLAEIRADDDNVSIFEENRKDAILIKTQHDREAPWHNYPTKWEFHIPIGSIKEEFKL